MSTRYEAIAATDSSDGAADAGAIPLLNANGKLDSTLFEGDLAALEALASVGFAARTAADTWAQRTLTAPAAGFTITNPAGIAGNPTFALANDLAAVEGLGTTGIVRRTGVDAWSAGTLVTHAEMETIATSRIIGRQSLGTGAREALTGTQVTAMLDNFTSGAKGLVPPSGGGTVNYMRADGTWAEPPGTGGGGGGLTQAQVLARSLGA